MTLSLPEIGPSLGGLTAPPATSGTGWIPVDDLRLALAGRLIALAGQARIAGDAAPGVLTAEAWSAAWHESVAAVADRVARIVDRKLKQAAEASRYPARRLTHALVTPADLRAITARLGEGGMSLQSSLEELERARTTLGGTQGPGRDAADEWLERVAATARRQESAWRELELALGREQPLWSREIEMVRNWRRPRWPLWLGAAVIYGAAIWLGLVLGGYVPVPPALTAPVAWFWDRF